MKKEIKNALIEIVFGATTLLTLSNILENTYQNGIVIGMLTMTVSSLVEFFLENKNKCQKSCEIKK